MCILKKLLLLLKIQDVLIVWGENDQIFLLERGEELKRYYVFIQYFIVTFILFPHEIINAMFL